MTKQSATITKHATISIALAITIISVIVGATIYIVSNLTRVQANLANHIGDPQLHHNIIQKIELNYVTRGELDSRFTALESTLTRIENNQKEIITRINSL